MEIEIDHSGTYLSCIPHPILVLDTKGCVLYGNPAFSKLTGIFEDELSGLPLEALKIGDRYKGFYWDNYQSLKAGEVVRQQFLQKRKNGDFRQFDIQLVAIECPLREGNVICFISTVSELTAVVEKTEQIRLMEEELQKAVDTLKQLLYKSSHDLRGPIATIKGIVSLAKLSSPGPEMNRYLDLIQGCSEKMDTMLFDLRKVYTMYLGNFVSETIDFKALIRKVLRKYKNRGVTVKSQVRVKREHLHCAYLVERILESLLDNAFK